MLAHQHVQSANSLVKMVNRIAYQKLGGVTGLQTAKISPMSYIVQNVHQLIIDVREEVLA